MTTGVIMGNTLALGVVDLTLSPVAVAANTTAEQTFTMPGVRMRDVILGINKPTSQAGLGIVNYRVVGFDQIGITFSNNTAAGVTPTAAEVYRVSYLRPEATLTGLSI